LASKAPDSDHRFARAGDQHEAHLEKDFQFPGDAVWRTVGESFSAVAALQNELSPSGGIGQLIAQRHDLPTGHQGGQQPQFVQGGLERIRIRIGRLLKGRTSAP
jgi:hypothetical protein